MSEPYACAGNKSSVTLRGQLPSAKRAGEVVAAYLRRGRSATSSRQVSAISLNPPPRLLRSGSQD